MYLTIKLILALLEDLILFFKVFRDKTVYVCFVPKDLDKQFRVFKKCKNKFVFLELEILLIRELSPSPNVQLDSIGVKLFV